MKSPLRLCLLLGPLALLGCDMADYQRRMDENRARLKVYDEENRYLGKALDVPRVKDAKEDTYSDAWPFDLFLRLPRGVAPGAEGTVGIFYKYPGDSGPSVYVAANNVSGDEPKKAKTEGMRPPTYVEFRDWGKKALMEWVRNDSFGNWVPLEEKPETRLIDIPATSIGGGRKLSFETFRYESTPPKTEKEKDSLIFIFYHYQSGENQVMIVFQYVKGKEEQKAMDLSLRTLALDADANVRRREYAKLSVKK